MTVATINDNNIKNDVNINNANEIEVIVGIDRLRQRYYNKR